MSLLRYSRPGHPTVLIPLEPARARPTGFGGQALGSVVAATVVAPAPKRLPRQRLHRERVLCGTLMPRAGTTCARTAGHRDSCRPQSWMDRRAAFQRTGL